MYEPTERELIGWFQILERRMLAVHGVVLRYMRDRDREKLVDRFTERATRYGRDLTGGLQYADKWMQRYLARKGI